MKLKSFGCSFVFGTDLKDCTADAPSKLTWPALIANDLGLEYVCHARGAVGNLYIAEKILNECEENDSTFFVVNWTFADRFDYTVPEINTIWLSCLPGDDTSVSNFYFRNLHSEYKDKLNSLILMKLCIDTMQQKNIKFIMTNIDDSVFDSHWHVTPAVKYLQQSVTQHCQTFNNKNFINYALDCGHKKTPNGHISEMAHRDIFNYAKTNFTQISNR